MDGEEWREERERGREGGRERERERGERGGRNKIMHAHHIKLSCGQLQKMSLYNLMKVHSSFGSPLGEKNDKNAHTH